MTLVDDPPESFDELHVIIIGASGQRILCTPKAKAGGVKKVCGL